LLKLQEVTRERFKKQLEQELRERKAAQEQQQQQENEQQEQDQNEMGKGEEVTAESLDQQQRQQEERVALGVGAEAATANGGAEAAVTAGVPGQCAAAGSCAAAAAAGGGGASSSVEVVSGIKVLPMVIEDTDGSDSDPDSPRCGAEGAAAAEDVGTTEMPALEDLVMASSIAPPLSLSEQHQHVAEGDEDVARADCTTSQLSASIDPSPAVGGSRANGVANAPVSNSSRSGSSSSGPDGSSRQQSKQDKVAAAAAALSLKQVEQQPRVPSWIATIPRGVEEFMKSCKALQRAGVANTGGAAGSGELSPLLQYVANIPPKSYGSVFKVGLSPDAISVLVGTWEGLVEQEPRFVVDSMEALSKVSRFGVCMGMASTMRGVLKGLQVVMLQLEEAGVDSSRLSDFRKVYMVK
jgi:hypothetical protein